MSGQKIKHMTWIKWVLSPVEISFPKPSANPAVQPSEDKVNEKNMVYS